MKIQTLITLVSLTGAAIAGPLSFDFTDPKGVNNAVFKLDAPLEAINGSANGIGGTVQFDPAHSNLDGLKTLAPPLYLGSAEFDEDGT